MTEIEVEVEYKETDVFLSSSFSHGFKFNSANLFCNTLNDNHDFFVNKEIFVKFESVVVKGVKSKSFLICLNALPYSVASRYSYLPYEQVNRSLADDCLRQIVKVCIPSDDGDKCLDGVRRFDFKNECYPFLLRSDDVWSVQMHDWTEERDVPNYMVPLNSADHEMISEYECADESTCFIHLKIMTRPSSEVKNIVKFPSNFNTLNPSVESICNMGMYPIYEDEDEVVLISRQLYTNVDVGKNVEGVEMSGDKMVRVEGGVIKNLSNIREPDNWMSIHINSALHVKNGDFYDYLEKHEKGCEIGRDLTVHFPVDYYSSIEDLVKVMNKEFRKVFIGYKGGVAPYIEFYVKNGFVIMKSLLYHDITVEMSRKFSDVIGFPHAFRLIGGGVPENFRANLIGHRRRLKGKMKGVKPCLNRFPSYFMIRSNIGGSGIYGETFPGVIGVVKCIGDVENGCLAFKNCADGKFSTRAGKCNRIDCDMYDVCDMDRYLNEEFKGCTLGVELFYG